MNIGGVIGEITDFQGLYHHQGAEYRSIKVSGKTKNRL
jgi:hypothetical protein